MKKILSLIIVISILLSAVNNNVLAAGNSAEIMYEEGMEFFEKEDYDRAFARFQIAGDVRGYAPAQNMLGVCYRDGLGAEQNSEEAEKYFQLASDQGYTPAQDNLAALIDQQKRKENENKETKPWIDYPVTEDNFTHFYDIELIENNFETAPDGSSITPQLTLTCKLKTEFADKLDRENSYVEVKIKGNYVFRGITSIDWYTGEISLSESSSAELIVNLQQIALINGNASLAEKFSRNLSETAGGVTEIPIPLNRLADGVFNFHGGIHGPISPLMRSDYVDNGICLAQLEDLEIVSVSGSLRLNEASEHTDEDREEDNLEYLPLKDGKAVITRYSGSGERVSVPKTMGGYPVSEIGDYAFAYCDTLREIVLPDGLTSIGKYAFEECRNLETIVLPDTITSIEDNSFEEYNINLVAIVSRGSYAEQYCQGHDLLYQYEDGTSPPKDVPAEDDFTYRLLEDGTAEITQYTGTIKRLEVPNQIGGHTVTSVGDSAFEQSNIISIALPDSVVSVGEDAFVSSNLVLITLPNNLRYIGKGAFNACSRLMFVTIPEGVEKIDDYTFYFCSNLTEVRIPNSVTAIGSHAFDGWGNLKTIVLPGSVTSIADNAFMDKEELMFIVEPGSYAEQYCKDNNRRYRYYTEN